MKKEMQTDLFEEAIQKKIKRNYYPSLKKLFPYGFVNIRLSYEGLIFSLIVFMLVCVVIFSLGVEKGKHSTLIVNDTPGLGNEVSKNYSSKKYTIQVAAYRDKKMALNLIKELMQNRYRPFVIYADKMYHVCIGKYLNKEIAREELYNLLKKYKTSYIRTIP
ncbi:MAG: SPOR domain-containing protein [Candidatus Omnitrophica bacterium]|nr:SPOR domain-containing protein [Candidatus Omnitrophota bacterium]